MKKILSILSAILLLLLLLSCELFIKPPSSGKVYAILVALDYKNIERPKDELDGTINDARELTLAFEAVAKRANLDYTGYLFLQEGGGTSNATVHTIGSDEAEINTFPTPQNLIDGIEALGTVVTDEDLIIFTYSGHGLENGEIALAKEGVKANSYTPATNILDAFNTIAGRKLIILDTCYSGVSIPESASSHSTVMHNNISKWYKKYWEESQYTKPDLFVLTASADTLSYEAEDIDGHSHGLFSFSLLEALGWQHPHNLDLAAIDISKLPPPPATRSSIMSADSLYTYIRNYKNPNRSFSLFSFGQPQHPMVSGGALDMVLFTF
jgi:uncharacterized caspase-like protein